MCCAHPTCHSLPELRAEVDIIEQMSSSSGSSSSDSESSSGSDDDDDSSSSGGEENASASPPQPLHQQPYGSRLDVANGTGRAQGSNQLMNTLREYGRKGKSKNISDLRKAEMSWKAGEIR